MDFQTAKNKAERLSPATVSRALFQLIRNLEKELVSLNIEQIEDHTDSFGKALDNTNKIFDGTYSQATEEIARNENPLASKNAGDPYNFLWTGEFLKGFELRIEGNALSFNNTGTGSGTKKAFFDGYKNLLGLTDENLNKVISERLLPFFLTYYRNELT
jgi:hypothetical protein